MKVKKFLRKSTSRRKSTPSLSLEPTNLNFSLSLILSFNQPFSFDTPIGGDGDSTLGDFIRGDQGRDGFAGVIEDPENQTERNQTDFDQVIGNLLSPREKEILELRFGRGGKEHTLEEVGQIFDLTRERIRQIQNRAERTLRRQHRLKKDDDQ